MIATESKMRLFPAKASHWLYLLCLSCLLCALLRIGFVRLRQTATNGFSLNQRMHTLSTAGCVLYVDDWQLFVSAMEHTDKLALALLVSKSKVIMVDPGIRGEVESALEGERIRVHLMEGEHLGTSCYLLATQITGD
ncbi:hypothetical protein [Paludibaculum fermentans]|uniref:hypothetical protein n=1 Tax=Paludibaculum fermentans TaxID=1473598 RepID=UPI003EB92666